MGRLIEKCVADHEFASASSLHFSFLLLILLLLLSCRKWPTEEDGSN